MTRQEVYEKLTTVFEDVFDEKRLKINDNTTSRDILGWDSLAHIRLIAAAEDEFSIQFPVQEAYTFKNVGQMVDAILRLTM